MVYGALARPAFALQSAIFRLLLAVVQPARYKNLSSAFACQLFVFDISTIGQVARIAVIFWVNCRMYVVLEAAETALPAP